MEVVMISNTRNISKSLFALVAVAGAFAITTTARSAQAGSIVGQVTQIEYNRSIWGIGLQLNNNSSINYVAQTTIPSGCNLVSPNIDSIKLMLSIAQTALLTGKSVTIGYDYCSTIGGYYMWDIKMAK
jgi:hypothetical protein